MSKYRKKPVVIEAKQWPMPDTVSYDDIRLAVCTKPDGPYEDGGELRGGGKILVQTFLPHLHTANGPVIVTNGTWVVRDPGGDVWPVADAIFAKTYEPVADESA